VGTAGAPVERAARPPVGLTGAQDAPRPFGPTAPSVLRQAGGFLLDYLAPFAAGLALTAALYLLVAANLPEAGVWGNVRESLSARGFAPYLCAMLALWYVSHQIVRFFARILRERRMLGEKIVPSGRVQFSREDAEEMARRAQASEAERGPRLLTRRALLAAAHLRISRDSGEVAELLRRSSDEDRQRLAASQAFPSFLLLAIPLAGLAGTLRLLGSALEGRAPGASSAAGLGASFDPLLVAVVAGLVCLFVRNLARASDSKLLAGIDSHFTLRLQSRIRTESLDSRMQDIIGDALRRLTVLQEAMQRTQADAQEAVKGAVGMLPGTLDTAAEAAARTIGAAAERQAAVSERIIQNLDASAAGAARGLGAEFNKVTSGLAESLKEVSDRLAAVCEGGKELAAIQAGLQRNLQELNKVQDLGATLGELKRLLTALGPVFESLNRPIPLKFTLDAGELELGG
jgi:biopolymer transport protein ExbB/TolQ